MNCEILCVGTELLLGDILNTNAQFLSKELSALGINVYFQTVVGDNPVRLEKALNIALLRADMVITTGGLGPTYDDLTKEIICSACGLTLVVFPEYLEKMNAYFVRQNRVMTKNNEKQAMLPKDCTPLDNDFGTAPGAICEFDYSGSNKTIIMLPGPPSELIPMFKNHVAPYLSSLSDECIVSSEVRVFGMGESTVEDKLHSLMATAENPTVAPYAKEGEVLLRVTAKAKTEEGARKMISPLLDKIKEELGVAVYGVDVSSMEEAVVNLLAEKGKTVSFAESCTGGLVSKRITDISGSSKVFLGSICAYSNAVKQELLGVSSELLERHGAVSSECALAMAQGVRKIMKTDFGVSVTGIAGPHSDNTDKPVGLVYIGISQEGKDEAFEFRFSGARSRIRTAASGNALDILRKNLLQE